jgi:hypothetical protein
MIIRQALEEIHPKVQTATEDLEFSSTEDSQHFDPGTTRAHHKVQILDHVNKVKRISMVKEGSRHIDMDTDWETVPTDDDLEEAADSSQPIPREADLGDSLQTALEYAFCPVAQNFSCHSLFLFKLWGSFSPFPSFFCL